MAGLFDAFKDKRLLIEAQSDTPGIPLFSFSVDATSSIQHNMTNVTTNHAIEDGSDVTDHIINRPDTLSVSGVISDSPSSFFAIGNPLITSALNGGKISKQVLDDYFLKARNDKLLFSITTGLRAYENLVMTSFSVTETAQTANSLNFTASFTVVKFVNAQIVALTAVPQDDVVAPVTTKKGDKPVTATTEKEKTNAAALYDAVSSAL